MMCLYLKDTEFFYVKNIIKNILVLILPDYKYCLITLKIVFLSIRPDCLQRVFPSRNINSVGTPRIWYRPAISLFLSTSILMTFIFSPSSRATSARIGDWILQGSHHSAEKSIRTGTDDWIIELKLPFILFVLRTKISTCITNSKSNFLTEMFNELI